MSTAPNVVAFPGIELAPLRVAATSYPGNRVEGSRNEIWLCSAYCRGNPVTLYVKIGLSARALMAECLGSLLAKCIGLHTPAPFLVTVQPRHVQRTGQHALLCFGSQDLSDHALARPVRNLKVLFDFLHSHKVADLACVFDEWIANEVRSPSDILIAPGERQIHFIDHEGAFPPALQADQPATNWLADRLIADLDERERELFLKRLRARLAALQRVDLGDAPGATQFASEGVATYRVLLQFLRDRLEHLDRLVSERVNPAQMYLR